MFSILLLSGTTRIRTGVSRVRVLRANRCTIAPKKMKKETKFHSINGSTHNPDTVSCETSRMHSWAFTNTFGMCAYIFVLSWPFVGRRMFWSFLFSFPPHCADYTEWYKTLTHTTNKKNTRAGSYFCLLVESVRDLFPSLLPSFRASRGRTWHTHSQHGMMISYPDGLQIQSR